jgi:hypothetical protein
MTPTLMHCGHHRRHLQLITYHENQLLTCEVSLWTTHILLSLDNMPMKINCQLVIFHYELHTYCSVLIKYQWKLIVDLWTFIMNYTHIAKSHYEEGTRCKVVDCSCNFENWGLTICQSQTYLAISNCKYIILHRGCRSKSNKIIRVNKFVSAIQLGCLICIMHGWKLLIW